VESSRAMTPGRALGRVDPTRERLRALVRAVIGPETERPAPVTYTLPVVTYVASVAAAAFVVAAITFRAPTDSLGLILVSVAIFFMSVASIRTVKGQEDVFTATTFLNVGLALTLGPIGCLGACAEATGFAIRYRSGWFRFSFNVATLFLSTWSAWGVFTLLTRAPVNGVAWIGFAALVAGLTLHFVNNLLLAGILFFATRRSIIDSIRATLPVLPYNLTYGYAAVGFLAVHDRFGSIGFTFSLAPVIALQVFLMILAHRTYEHELQRDHLMDQIVDKSVQVERSYDATLVALTHALDARDKETEGHSRRVVEYTRLVAVELGISGDELKILCHGALLHDIGKIGVPDAILHKPDKLTEQEWQVMRRHPEIGALMVEEVEYLAEARRIILHHHERWDGRGYPLGLRGTQITLGARAFAVADTVDAITQDRPYRRGRSFDEAREELRVHRGTQFDPDAVDAFLALDHEALIRIAGIRSRVSVDLLSGPMILRRARPGALVTASR
jgi:putative nucleotidyltransferase with HDIG domain